MTSLTGKVAIITGGGSGIGRACAMRLAAEGAKVVVADRDASTSQQTVDLITAASGTAVSIPTDVSVDAMLQNLVTQTLEKFGRIDILHSHAGIQVEGTAELVSLAGFDTSWMINVRAHFLLIRLVLAPMKLQRSGTIIVTSSNSGLLYDAGMVAYTTTKHAVIAMVKQIAKDYGSFGVRINALCPGWIDTAFNAPFQKQLGGREALLKFVADHVPLARFGTVEEVAEALLFLASDRSSFMTGTALVLDGGEAL